MSRRMSLVALIGLALAGIACESSRVAGAPGDPEGAVPGDGEQAFRDLGCSECHSDKAGAVAPSLRGVFGGEVLLEGGETETVDEDYIRESILSPGAKVVRGFPNIMPSYQERVSQDQLEALVGYLRSLAQP
jgi:cytochrome c oxidase subunit II